MKIELKSKIENLFNQHIDKFIGSLKDEEFGDQTNVEKFYASELFRDFSTIVLAELIEELKGMQITSGEFEEITNNYRITYTEDQINKFISESDPPMPSSNPPTGQKWVKERKADGKAEWVLVNEA